jgi:sulfoxide reductase heme-binding subunit YedZ
LTPIIILKRVIFAAALIPAAWLVVGFFTDDLTANPIQYITDQTGTWALTFLVITLTVTPIRRLTGWNQIIRVRRMLGLFCFFYATLHFLTWFVLDQFFDIAFMAEDIVSRPFIMMGMTTYLLLLPLAITSTNAMARRLGRRWQQLHRLVYVAPVCAIVHFWWAVSSKAGAGEPRNWAIVLSLLLGFRVWWTLRTRTFSRS